VSWNYENWSGTISLNSSNAWIPQVQESLGQDYDINLINLDKSTIERGKKGVLHVKKKDMKWGRKGNSFSFQNYHCTKDPLLNDRGLKKQFLRITFEVYGEAAIVMARESHLQCNRHKILLE